MRKIMNGYRVMYIPYSSCMILARSRNEVPLRMKTNRVNGSIMREPLQFIPLFKIPDSGRHVITGGCDALSFGAKIDVFYYPIVIKRVYWNAISSPPSPL